MSIRGKAFRYGANVDTDVIIPARYLNTSDPKELAAHCLEDLDPSFVDTVQAGDLVVAEANFGCGSSREHAPVALKASGVSCVIASSFARIFYRNAINMGLAILESDQAVQDIQQGDTVRVDLASGRIENERTGAVFQAQPFPPFIQKIMATDGLMGTLKDKRC